MRIGKFSGIYPCVRKKERVLIRHKIICDIGICLFSKKRYNGLSSHTPATINQILDTAPVDMLMFSVNPAYDYQQGDYANGSVDERAALYRRCDTEGIGISVMKPFSGGQLLDASLSPFEKALSIYQCIQYSSSLPK